MIRFRLKVLCTIFSVLYLSCLYGQDPFPLEMQITLPSPTAMAFHKAGNTDVSLYSGSASISIPLAAAISKSLSSHVTLNYSASSGVKVEEMPTWVGLGWTLNAGGSVSRVIRGRVDDGENGYTNLPPLPPSLENVATDPIADEYVTSVGDGTKDGEPDKFFFNAGGMSGSFFIRKDGNIMQVPQSDNKIVPIYTTQGQIPDGSLGISLKGSLLGFDVIGTDGTVYKFRDYEFSMSRPLGTNSWTDDTYKMSSWYLTEISHPSHTGKISFTYGQYLTTLVTESVANKIPLNGTFQPSYTRSSTYALRLEKIEHDQGTIIFNTGENRCDFKDDKVLSSIEVKNLAGDLLKKYTFDYTYFTANGIVPFDDPCETIYLGGDAVNYDGDYRKRLKLDKIVEWDENQANSIVHSSFEYDQLHYLPNRHSKARDHWGYYNGQTSNTTLEPAYTKYMYLGLYDGYVYVKGGTANREARPNYGKAGMLKKIKYKTGGYTEFFYEGNDVYSDKRVYRKVEGSPLVFHYDQSPAILNASANTSEILIEVFSSPLSGTYCGIEVILQEINDNTVESFNLSEQPSGPARGSVNVAPGEYQIQINTYNNGGGCIPENIPDLFFNVKWSYLVPDGIETKRPVGGLRIAKTVDSKSAGSPVLVNEYSYELEEALNFSSGHLVNDPEYGFLEVFNPNEIGWEDWPPGIIPLTWVRTYNSNLPLASTKGNVVGYERVVKKQTNLNGIENGYSVYEYTSPKGHSDHTRGWLLKKYDDRFDIGSESLQIWPPAVTDSREWQRGLLLKQADYKLVNENPVPVSMQIYNYEFFEPNEISGSNADLFVNALKMDGQSYARFYQQFTGRYQLNFVASTLYDESDQNKFLTTVKNYQYDSPNHYFKTSETTTNSEGDLHTTAYRYVSDYQNPALDITEMQSANMVGMVLEQFKFLNNDITEAFAYKYAEDASGFIVQEGVYKYEISTIGGMYPESPDGADFTGYRKLTAATYDSKGNLTSFEHSNGMTSSYIWGYSGTLPIVKIENASLEDIDTVLGTDFTLDDPSGDVLSSSQLNAIRSISGAYVTSYTYMQGRGISTIVDQNGLQTTYEYDDYGRLSLVRDHNQHIIQLVDYKYAGE